MGIATDLLPAAGLDKAGAPPSSLSEAAPNEGALPQENTAVESLDDQCGFENDGIAWVKLEPPVRKLVCEATPEKQAKFRALLDKIFSPLHAVINRRVAFVPNDLIEICAEVQPYLASEPQFIEDVQPPITIIADLHGQLHDLHKIFIGHSKDGKPGYECARFLFLGDYVERGLQSVEIVAALFMLKVLYPSEFILLRGNHEFANVNKAEFTGELESRYILKTAKVLWGVFNSTFQWLSLCAIVGGKVFCAHGGISRSGFSRTSLRDLSKPIRYSNESYLVQDLVWSDPAEGLEGTCFNLGRKSSLLFGEDAFALAMDAIDCLFMFRGHSRIMDGYELTWERCYTIFSCPDSLLSENKGSFAQLDKDLRVKILIMDVDPIRHRIEQKYFHMINKEEGDKTTVDDSELGSGTITKMQKS